MKEKEGKMEGDRRHKKDLERTSERQFLLHLAIALLGIIPAFLGNQSYRSW